MIDDLTLAILRNRLIAITEEQAQHLLRSAFSVIVREAGGFVTDFRGGDRAIERSEFLAGNDATHSKLQKLVAGALRN